MTTIQDKLAARAAAAIERNGAQDDVVAGGGEKKNWALAPAGKQKARLIGYVEKGKQLNRIDASKPAVNKFHLYFALFGKGCQEEDGTPIVVASRDWSVSRGAKATAVKEFKSMCPKGDAHHFMELIDRVFWLDIVHNPSKQLGEDGKPKAIYANISPGSIKPGVVEIINEETDEITGYRDAACPPAPENMFVILEWDVPSKEDFDKIKPFHQADLRNSEGFQGSAWQQLVGDAKPRSDEPDGNGGAGTNAPPTDEEEPAGTTADQVPVDDTPVNAGDLPQL